MKRITFLALTFVCSAFILSCDKDKDDVQKGSVPLCTFYLWNMLYKSSLTFAVFSTSA